MANRKPETDEIETQSLRWVMLNLLWHALPSEASDRWLKQQLIKAGATQAEVDRIVQSTED